MKLLNANVECANTADLMVLVVIYRSIIVGEGIFSSSYLSGAIEEAFVI
jgi:hypothetical protein